MRSLRDLVSPMAVASLALWLVVLVVVTNLAIPVFANVGSGPQPFCPGTTCARQPTIEWLPSLATAFMVSTVAVGTLWGAMAHLRRRR